MARNDIYLITKHKEEIIGVIRYNCDLCIKIDRKLLLNVRIQFFINENNIIFIKDIDQILDMKFLINVSNKDDNQSDIYTIFIVWFLIFY